jgi:Lon protease-like protein
MFPLGSVLFPHAVIPLHVFEPRYRVMMRHCLDGDREFGVVLIERGSEVGGGDVRFDVGTAARIVQADELPDGRFAVVAVGVRRVRVVRWLPDDPYPQAEVDDLVEPAPDAGAAAAVAGVVDAFDALLALWRIVNPDLPERLPAFDADPNRALFEMAAAAPIETLDAQRVLEAANATTRAALLERMVRERTEDLRAQLDG